MISLESRRRYSEYADYYTIDFLFDCSFGNINQCRDNVMFSNISEEYRYDTYSVPVQSSSQKSTTIPRGVYDIVIVNPSLS